MKLKSDWVYNYQKGIRSPLTSVSHHIENDKLFFVLEFGSFPYTSLLLELDLNTQACQVLYEVPHIVRNFVLENERFYFTAMNSYVYCLGKDGSLIWQTKIGKGNPSMEVTIDGDRIYASNRATFCLDKNSGEILWQNEEYKKPSRCNLLVHENHIISGEQGGKVFCLDKMTGEDVWEYGEKEWINECVLFGNGHLLVTDSSGKFIILDPKTGKFVKEMDARGKLYQKVVFDAGRMYAGDADSSMDSTSGNMTCYEVSGDDLKEVLFYKPGGGISTPARIDGEELFFASEDGNFYCIDKNTGEEKAKKKTKGTCHDFIVRGDEVIILSDKGQVEHFSVSEGG